MKVLPVPADALDDLGKLLCWHDMIDACISNCRLRHVADCGIGRYLHDSDATATFDRGKTGAPVIQCTTEDYSDHTRSIDDGGGAKEHIDSWPPLILTRTPGEPGNPP